MGEELIGNTFLGVFFPHKKKYDFPEFMAFAYMKFPAIPLHSQCIKCLNKLLEESNDWVHKKKWLVESFMGSPIDIWLYTIGSRV